MSAFVDFLDNLFRLNANKEKAAEMTQYMRSLFPFVGIPSVPRRLLLRQATTEIGFPKNVMDVVHELWTYKEREYHHSAVDLLSTAVTRKKSPLQYSASLVMELEELIVSNSWWDTVDFLSPRVAGTLLMSRSELGTVTTAWIESENFWLQRSAIIIQLHYKSETNFNLLSRLILKRSDSTEFFVRKGAGWALREFSKTEPKTVRNFIDQYRERLSNLTVREGGKYC